MVDWKDLADQDMSDKIVDGTAYNFGARLEDAGAIHTGYWLNSDTTDYVVDLESGQTVEFELDGNRNINEVDRHDGPP